MTKILWVFLVVSLVSCSKKNSDVTIAPTPPPAMIGDSLGAGWSKINSPQNETQLYDIFFTNSQSGFAVGQKGIYKSVNAGNTWLQVVNNVTFLSISSYSAKSIFAGPINKIHNTQNAVLFNASQITGTLNDNGFYDCFFTSGSICYATSENAVYKSVDGGLNFFTIKIFNDAANITALSFLNDNMGFMGRANKLYKTIDGGTNWLLLNTASTSSVTAIEYLSTNIIYYASIVGVFKSIDGGTTFNLVFNLSGNLFSDIDFIDATNGYLCFGKQIFKTVDAGANWNKVVGLAGSSLLEIHFTDLNHGWACGDSLIYRYSN
ncbi:MAG: hypothetical protein LH615_14185 [Ferruginibacter sp.]|nr:hypothetical protein [Ferruginibacter sp.]